MRAHSWGPFNNSLLALISEQKAQPAEDSGSGAVLVIKTETTKRRGGERLYFLSHRLFGAECPWKVLQ